LNVVQKIFDCLVKVFSVVKKRNAIKLDMWEELCRTLYKQDPRAL